jgi:hypothetical protein
MKTLAIAALTTILLTIAAHAEDKAEAEAANRKRKAQEIERQYRDSLKRTRTQPGAASTDPWADLRSAAPAKPKR